MDEHLIGKDKLAEFIAEMYSELLKHKSEKAGLKNWSYDAVFDLVIHDLEERQHRLNLDHTEINYSGKPSDPTFVAKQCIHMANYCFMLWQKAMEKQMQSKVNLS